MGLADELGRAGEAAGRFAAGDERVVAVLAAEGAEGERVYLCAFDAGDAGRTWLALDANGEPIRSRAILREAVTMAAMCELAEESAGGGDLAELRSRLVALRLTENPPGIDEAEEAALALETAVGAPPRVATAAYLDEVGAASRRLEQALGEGGSPFAAAMRDGLPAVERLAAEVEAAYKLELE